MITLGLSNGQIADLLVISPRTVSTHVEHVLEKLSAPTRAAAAIATSERLLLADAVAAKIRRLTDVRPSRGR